MLALLAACSLWVATPRTPPAADPDTRRQPTNFAIVYNHGYAGDHLPADKDEFEKVVKAAKEMHFNVGKTTGWNWCGWRSDGGTGNAVTG